MKRLIKHAQRSNYRSMVRIHKQPFKIDSMIRPYSQTMGLRNNQESKNQEEDPLLSKTIQKQVKDAGVSVHRENDVINFEKPSHVDVYSPTTTIHVNNTQDNDSNKDHSNKKKTDNRTKLIFYGLWLFVVYMTWDEWMPIFIRRISLQLEIDERDDAFKWMMFWLHQLPYTEECTDLSIYTKHQYNGNESFLNRLREATKQQDASIDVRMLPASGIHYVLYKGKLIRLFYEKHMDQQNGEEHLKQYLTLTIPFSQDRDFLVQLVADAKALYESQNEGKTIIYTPDVLMNTYNWKEVGQKVKRPIESVILDGNMMDDLLVDLDAFVNDEEKYRKRGIPYRRGYLLHGPPGTGKTSSILAIAGERGHNVCLLNLSNPNLNDEGLNQLLLNAPKDSMIILEDIDAACVNAVVQPFDFNVDADQNKVTLSGLLNALDGIASQEGRVVFATTNHPENLRPELIRPGRFDRRLAYDVASSAQIQGMFALYFDDEQLDDAHVDFLLHQKITPAELMGMFLRFDEGIDARHHIDLWMDAKNDVA
mmetsp:Transcript_6313/g.9185  ORF Transcript_6313/g.9185 Transcript_6313/m.9185 type:complete len:536 (-) Transcript_6313:47-1654(-)